MPTINRQTSSPKTRDRRTRCLSDWTQRKERTMRAKFNHPYEGEDKEIFWATLKELNEAPFPFLYEIKNPQITKCVSLLKKNGFNVIAPRANYEPKFLASSSKELSRPRSCRACSRRLRPQSSHMSSHHMHPGYCHACSGKLRPQHSRRRVCRPCSRRMQPSLSRRVCRPCSRRMQPRLSRRVCRPCSRRM